jgi:hypothetical protein
MSRRLSSLAAGFALVSGLWAASLAGSTEAHAYPSFIGYGYTSCVTCHNHPLGNGPLTDYGRAVSATAISGRPPFAAQLAGSDTPPAEIDDKLGERSGFLLGGGGSFYKDHIRPQIGYRNLGVWSNFQNAGQRAFNGYLMQLDGVLVLKTADDRFWASLEGGFQQNAASSLISREHYVGAVVTDQLAGGTLRAMAGLMDIAYGIRVPDHNLFSRKATLLAQNDQTHGLLLHYSHEGGEVGLHAFVGNLSQDSALRLRGFAATGEKQLGEKSRLGASALYFWNDFRSRTQGAVHWRQGFGEGQSILAESGLIFESPSGPSPLNSTTGLYAMTQGMQRLFRGFHLLATVDGYVPKFDGTVSRFLRLAPGVQWFVFQRLELRADVQNAFTFVPGADTIYSLNLLGQIHVTL